jgi:hypothetical protein
VSKSENHAAVIPCPVMCFHFKVLEQRCCFISFITDQSLIVEHTLHYYNVTVAVGTSTSRYSHFDLRAFIMVV